LLIQEGYGAELYVFSLARKGLGFRLIQEGYGAELLAAPSPNTYEMIEKLGYLILLRRPPALTAGPLPPRGFGDYLVRSTQVAVIGFIFPNSSAMVKEF
jgi:hypothetical protein